MARDTDDDAPWLAEGVPDARGSTLVPQGRLFGGIALFVLLAALVGVGLYVVISGKKSSGSSVGVTRAADAPLIAADPGPYKVAPAERGGLTVEGDEQTIYSAGTGVDAGGVIDPARAPEEPLARPGTVAAAPEGNAPRDLLPAAAAVEPAAKVLPEPKPAMPKPVTLKPATLKPAVPTPVVAKPLIVKSMPPAKPAAPVEVKTEAKPSAGGVALQLGAFSTAAKADAAWGKLIARHGGLAGLSHRIEPLERSGATLYRLRAAVADRAAAASWCGKLGAAGDACLVAD